MAQIKLPIDESLPAYVNESIVALEELVRSDHFSAFEKLSRLSKGEILVLKILLLQGGTTTPTEISEAMNSTKGRVSAVLNALEKKGEVTREIDKDNSMAKLSNILCVYEMADRLNAAGKKITVNAFNPGLMTDTNFMPTGSKVKKALISAGSTMVAKLTNRYGSGLTSGKELAKMVTEESFEGVTGKYNDRGTITKTSEPSYDKKAAKKLWEQSVELLKMDQDEMIL